MRKATFYRSSEDEGRALLARARAVHVATTGDDGRPLLRVVHGVVDAALGALAFHGAPVGEKLEGLGRRAVASAHEVVAELPSWFFDPERACPATTYYVSAQAEGVLEEVRDRDAKARVLQALMERFQPEGRHAPIRADDPRYTKELDGLLVVALRIERIACKAKLGQNRRPEERTRVIEQLWRRGAREPGDAAAVDLLVRRLPDRELVPSFLRAPGLLLGCALAGDEVEEVLALLDDPRAYWLEDIPVDVRRAAIQSSQAVVTARDAASGRLVGFARAVSDGRVAWIYDVIVAEERRRAGTGTALVRLLLDHPAVRGASRVRLGTRDASDFYRRLGFAPLSQAQRAEGGSSVEMFRPGPR